MNEGEWEKEFERLFPHVGTDERDFDGQGIRDEIKSFIRKNFIPKAELAKVVDGMRWDLTNHCHLPKQAHHEAAIHNAVLEALKYLFRLRP